jgi:hypothetical protein
MVVAALLILSSCSAAGVSSSARVTAPTEPTTTTSSTTLPKPSTTTTTFGLTTTTTLPPWEPTLTCFRATPPPYGPDGYEFDEDFYTHWCSASGIPVIGSAQVPLVALEAAAQLVNGVIGYDRVNTTETIANGGLVVLYGPGETASDLPEWSFVEGQTQQLSDDHPGFTATGGGITFSVVVWDDPVCAVPSERQNAYGTPEWGSVLVHELGHLAAGPATRTRLAGIAGNIDVAYQAALDGSAWDDRHYAMSNPAEYWAEATQIYFGQYNESTRGFRHPRTRVELAEQDPLVTALLETVYGDTTGIGTYWCSVYEGPITLLPKDGSPGEYAPVP